MYSIYRYIHAASVDFQKAVISPGQNHHQRIGAGGEGDLGQRCCGVPEETTLKLEGMGMG